jgi:hypothetical protein
MPGNHAYLSASGSFKWALCPGSPALEANYEEKSSPYAEEGTLAHSVAEAILKRPLSPQFPLTLNQQEEPQSMIDYAQMYVDYIYRVVPLSHHHLIQIELQVDFSQWVEGGWGTSDASCLVGDTLHVFDLKYGKGVKVDADNNFQLRLYALGVYASLAEADRPRNFALHICQPRIDNFQVEFLSLQDLLTFADWISERARLALSPGSPRIPGEKQCTFCKAKANCPELKAHIEKEMAIEFDDFDLPFLSQIDDEQKSRILNASGMLIAFIAAIKDEFTNRLLEGHNIKGWKLVHGRGSRSWIDEDCAADALELILPESDIYEKKLISPPKAEKLLGKKHAKTILSNLCLTKDGAPTLVVEADPRQQMNNPTKELQNDFSTFDD